MELPMIWLSYNLGKGHRKYSRLCYGADCDVPRLRKRDTTLQDLCFIDSGGWTQSMTEEKSVPKLPTE